MGIPVAAVVTTYWPGSHADVIVGKVLDGYDQRGGPGSSLDLVSIYVEQHPPNDMSADLARRHGFAIVPTIEDALTMGRPGLAVDGVLLIGEHGDYPLNAKGQQLYPRRRFLEAIAGVFERTGRSVPVFNDKGLAQSWEDARWMVETSRDLGFPLLAGSSVPHSWRVPPVDLPIGADVEHAVVVANSGLERYGFHALEGLQCIVERRAGGETGVLSVQFVPPDRMWQALDAAPWLIPTFEDALRRVAGHADGDVRAFPFGQECGLFLLEYADGLRAAVAMLDGYVIDGASGGLTFSARLAGRRRPLGTRFDLAHAPPYGHFAFLLRAIETMIATGRAPYPVERTLLTTGILDAVMTSRFEGGRPIDTPHLAIRYAPSSWPFARTRWPQP